MQDDPAGPDHETGRLADGRSYRVTKAHVEVMRESEIVHRVPIGEIAAVSRGGRDVIVTRKGTDPVSVTGATVDDARRLEDAIRHLLGQPGRRRWRW